MYFCVLSSKREKEITRNRRNCKLDRRFQMSWKERLEFIRYFLCFKYKAKNVTF